MNCKKLLSVISVVLCVLMLLNTVAVAIEPQPDATVESISIFNRYGVLLGETYQMTATVNSEGSLFNAVEWSSSNPDAISCTEDGKIKGLIAGEKATITCKAKWGKAKDSVDVYCAERVNPVKSILKDPFTNVYTKPYSGIIGGIIINFNWFIQLILDYLLPYSGILVSSDAIAASSTVTVYGRIKNYAYVHYGETELFDGFVKYSVLGTEIDGFLGLSSKNLDVWANDITYSHRKLTTDYKGSVKWSDSDKDNKYIDFDETTGQIIGKSGSAGNKVTITATADGMSTSCTIHLLYKWPQQWTGKTNIKTTLLLSDGTGYKNSSVTLEKGQSFTVHGDCGTNDGKAYGVANIGGKDCWGYVPISCLSTKGTISQYNNIKTAIIENGKEKKVPWVWPIADKGIKNISSPYAPRSDSTSTTIHHRGMDITTGVPGEIAGEPVVSTCSGIVKGLRLNIDSCGYCISISSDCTDTVTGEKIAIVYMHLQSVPKYSDGTPIKIGDNVSAGMVIGKVGKTNGETNSGMGYHLHFEANNKNAAVGNSGRSNFVNTINPIYFYIDTQSNVTFSSTDSYKQYGGYWYAINS